MPILRVTVWSFMPPFFFLFFQLDSEHPHNHGSEASPTNPLNQMEKNLSNKPSEGQRTALGQERQQSTIPKADFTPKHQEGNETGQWVYPSEQMFYNAMKVRVFRM